MTMSRHSGLTCSYPKRQYHCRERGEQMDQIDAAEPLAFLDNSAGTEGFRALRSGDPTWSLCY